MNDNPIDFKKRVLCSDGTCIGVIGTDGKCRECGKLEEEQPSVISEGLDSGLVECEFCKGKIKQEVTYCKHCGIMLRG